MVRRPSSLVTWLPIATKEGEFLAGYSGCGLSALRFPDDRGRLLLAPETSSESRWQNWHERTVAAVHAILTGHEPETLPPLDLAEGTEFQRRVWVELRTIGRGQTRSYGEVARAIGKPAAVRAVGGACGANPVPLLIPCHRVLAAQQKLGGFSGGLAWKRKLLAREGVWLAV